jgi:hypothetical protein
MAGGQVPGSDAEKMSGAVGWQLCYEEKRRAEKARSESDGHRP